MTAAPTNRYSDPPSVAVPTGSVAAVRPRWRRDPALVIGGGLVVLMAACALLAGWLAPYEPTEMGPLEEQLAAPSREHLLGTDALARDILSRLLYGSRVSLLVGWVSVLVGVCVGTLIGLVAGLGPGKLDRILMGVTDLFLAFPRVFLVLLLVSLTAPSLLLVMVVLGLTGWMSVARLVRAEVLSLRERDFVAAAAGLGLSLPQLAWRHLLPNVMPLVIVAATLRVGNAILLESFLSFLGLGAQEPTVTWGAMIEQGRHYLVEGWWLTTFPGLAIALTVVGYNLLGDGLGELLDPRARRGVADRHD